MLNFKIFLSLSVSLKHSYKNVQLVSLKAKELLLLRKSFFSSTSSFYGVE
jgi:hypothetical protein